MTKVPKLPIQSILNPSPPLCPRTPHSQRSGSELSSPASDFNDVLATSAKGNPPTRAKRSRDSSDLTYSRPQPPIKYPPYEVLDEVAYSRMAKFKVYPLGEIGKFCVHIPYSSDKKDVFEKTGRESFYVFVYRYTNPIDNIDYDVMWDYIDGFVRISPFFKSRKHKKTGPAKMLDLNTGLRDLTFHMTGGNRVAQGYWLPYDCAKAVCITFCHPIAGALIPIFGPGFPDECIPPESPMFGRMQISDELIRQAKLDSTANRHANNLSMGQRTAAVTSHPRSENRSFPPLGHMPSPQPHLDVQPHYQYPYPIASHAWRPVESIPGHYPPPPAPNPPTHSWSEAVIGSTRPTVSPTATSVWDAPSNARPILGTGLSLLHPLFRETPQPDSQSTPRAEEPLFKKPRLDIEDTNRQSFPAEARASIRRILAPETNQPIPVEATAERRLVSPPPQPKKLYRRRRHSTRFDSNEMRVAFSLVALSKGFRLEPLEKQYQGDMVRSNSF